MRQSYKMYSHPKVVENVAGLTFDESKHQNSRTKTRWNTSSYSPTRQKNILRTTHTSPQRTPSPKQKLNQKRQRRIRSAPPKKRNDSRIHRHNDKLIQALALGTDSSSWYKQEFSGELDEVRHALKFSEQSTKQVQRVRKDIERFEQIHSEQKIIDIILASVMNNRIRSEHDLVMLLVILLENNIRVVPSKKYQSGRTTCSISTSPSISTSTRTNQTQLKPEKILHTLHVHKLLLVHQFGSEFTSGLQNELVKCQTLEAKFATDVLNVASSIYNGMEAKNFDELLVAKKWQTRSFQMFVPQLTHALVRTKILSTRDKSNVNASAPSFLSKVNQQFATNTRTSKDKMKKNSTKNDNNQNDNNQNDNNQNDNKKYDKNNNKNNNKNSNKNGNKNSSKKSKMSFPAQNIHDSLFELHRRASSMELSMSLSPNKNHSRTRNVCDAVFSALKINCDSIEGQRENNDNNVNNEKNESDNSFVNEPKQWVPKQWVPKQWISWPAATAICIVCFVFVKHTKSGTAVHV